CKPALVAPSGSRRLLRLAHDVRARRVCASAISGNSGSARRHETARGLKRGGHWPYPAVSRPWHALRWRSGERRKPAARTSRSKIDKAFFKPLATLVRSGSTVLRTAPSRCFAVAVIEISVMPRRERLVTAMQQADWLKQLGMSEYTERFVENHIDESIIRELTDEDLKDLGVGSLGHRRKLLRAIQQL